MNPGLLLILCLYLLKETFERVLEHLNVSHMRRAGTAVPPEFAGQAGEGLIGRTHDYVAEKTRFSTVSSLLGAAVTVLFVFGGGLDLFNSWVSSLGLSFVVSGWLFFLLLSVGGELLSVPFSLYRTFRIENRYGFNTMTPRLWLTDFIKSVLLSVVLMSVVLLAGFWIIQSSPLYWWLWVWGFLLLFSVFMMYLSPYVIEPLFNVFTPLADERLREDIAALARKAGIRVSRVLKVDASRRSRHTNAYFTGIGKTKRIVLFDTLLERLSPREILAVLAHEIGHWKRKHLFKTIVAIEAFSLGGLYLTSRLVESDALLQVFGIGSHTMNAKLLLVAFLLGIALFPLKPIACSLSRSHEREADRVSFELTDDADSMIAALVKLSRDNLANLHPHPLYVIFHYTHPPVIERIRLIREMGTKRTGQGP